MKLTLEVTKENKEKIKKLIDLLLEENIGIEGETKAMLSESGSHGMSATPSCLKIPTMRNESVSGEISVNLGDKRTSFVGSWGQFNSFFSVKAALRILANFLEENKKTSVNLKEFVDFSLKIFSNTKISGTPMRKFRGFPSSDKDSAAGRFVWHFLCTAEEMGLIKITKSSLEYDGMPLTFHGWGKVDITITGEGLKFAKLENNLFDRGDPVQVLTEAEKVWLLDYLKKIDVKGYREYSLLRDVYEFLKAENPGKEELFSWLENNKNFVKYIKKWSRKNKSGDKKAFEKQLKNLAATFACSKIALLRELGVVSPKRNVYDIVGKFE